MPRERPKPEWMILRERVRARLVRALGDDEHVVAEGVAHDRSPAWDTDGGERHAYVVVTPRRIVWAVREGVLSLSFDEVTTAEDAFEAHRWYVRLRHRRLNRPGRYRQLPWDLPAHIRLLRRGRRVGRETIFQFSRYETAAAKAVRDRIPQPSRVHDLAPRRSRRGVTKIVRFDPGRPPGPLKDRSID